MAEIVSISTRLPLLAAPLFVAVGAYAAGVRGLLWGLLCLFLTSGLSLLYLLYLTRSRRIRDPWRIPRAERVKPLRIVALLHLGAFVISVLLGVPAPLQATLLSYAIATVIFAGLAPATNLSLHAAGVSGAAVCLMFVFGAWGAAGVLLVPPVVWARTVLKRHTPIELMIGVLVGSGGTWLAFQLAG